MEWVSDQQPINVLYAAALQHDSESTMCVKSAENLKQTPWLNSLWQIQMFSSLVLCENVSITYRGENMTGCFGRVCRSVLLWRCTSESRNRHLTWAGIVFRHPASQHVLRQSSNPLYCLEVSHVPSFFSLLRWNIWSWKSICQRYKRTIPASRNNFITSLCFKFNFNINWKCIT